MTEATHQVTSGHETTTPDCGVEQGARIGPQLTYYPEPTLGSGVAPMGRGFVASLKASLRWSCLATAYLAASLTIALGILFLIGGPEASRFDASPTWLTWSVVVPTACFALLCAALHDGPAGKGGALPWSLITLIAVVLASVRAVRAPGEPQRVNLELFGHGFRMEVVATCVSSGQSVAQASSRTLRGLLSNPPNWA